MNTSGLDEVPAEEVTNQLNKILNSPLFCQSERQCRFLKYIVDHVINGNTSRLKGYTIGIDVFDRDESFDPNIDSIVRVEAARLRSKLHEYYYTLGIDDTVLIEIPKGKYFPLIRFNVIGDHKSSQQKSVKEQIYLDRQSPKNSVAVLPLRSLSDDVNQDYFSIGITDAIITSLAKYNSLKVISLTSVMRYRNTDIPLKQIVNELNVSHIVEGTVVNEGNNIRVSTQLIEGNTEYSIWAENFDRKLNRVLKLQQELADLIASHLIQKFNPADINNPGLRSIKPEAYELYLLGRKCRTQFTRESFYKAADYFNRAIDIDPEYAPAYSGLASCFCGLGSQGFELECPIDVIPKGLNYAERAIDIDNMLTDPYTYTAIMKLKYEWDWPGAESYFRKALSISPNDSRAHLQYSMYFESLANHEQAINEAYQAYLVDPLSKEVNMNLAWQYYQAGMLDEARDRLDHLLELEPDFWGVYWDLAHIYIAEDDFDNAIDAFKKSDNVKGGYFMPLQGLGYAYAASGRKSEAIDIIDRLVDINKNNYVSPYYFATIYAGLNDKDTCFKWLYEAFENRSRSLAWLNVAREYIPFRSDQRFKDLVNRIGIPSNS